MKLKEKLDMINEENSYINDSCKCVYYILRHIVYDKTEQEERFVLGKLLLQLFQDIETNAEGISNVLSGI